jgi:hypothetical protein
MLNITIHQQPFANMFSSALESYVVPTPNQAAAIHIPVETGGSLFGQNTGTNNNVHLEISYASAHVSADRQPGQCTWSSESEMLHRIVHTKAMPSTEYLGNFHSHPYHRDELLNDSTPINARLITKEGLYRFSGCPEDRSSGDFASMTHRLKGGAYFIGLVITLYRESRSSEFYGPRYLDHHSAIEFPFYAGKLFGKQLLFRCWLKAYVFYPYSNHPVDDDAIGLYCPVLGMTHNLIC